MPPAALPGDAHSAGALSLKESEKNYPNLTLIIDFIILDFLSETN